MFRLESVLQLKDEEILQTMVRRHMITVAGPLFLALLFIVLPFFFLFPMFSWGTVGVLLFGACVIFGAGLAFRTIFVWDSDVLIVTNLRVIDVDQKGIFSRHVSESSLGAIQDVSWTKKGLWATLFGMGSVKIQTSGAQAVLEAEDIPGPERVHEMINQLKDQAPKASGRENFEPQDRRGRIKRMVLWLEEMDDEQLSEMENTLRRKSKEKAVSSFLADQNK